MIRFKATSWGTVRRLLWSALILAGAAATSASLAQDRLRISGTVADQQGQPVVGAHVSLTPITDKGDVDPAGTPMKIDSDKKGRFTFGFAKPGGYVLRCEFTGQILSGVGVKMRDADRHVPLLPDGTRIEDRSGPVDPAKPEIQIRIPSKVFTVDLALTLGPPPAPTANTGIGGPAGLPEAQAKELRQARLDVEGGNFEAALTEIAAILDRKPELSNDDMAALRYMEAFSHAKLGHWAEAEAPIRAALALNPTLPTGNWLLGQSLLLQRKFPEAIPPLETEVAATTDPAQRTPLLFNLGQAYLEVNQNDKAVTMLEEAHRLAPTDQQIQIQLANAYTLVGRDADAEALISPDLDPKVGATLHYNLAAALFKSKKWDAVIHHLQQVVVLDPSIAEAHRYLGDAYMALDNKAEAVKAFEAYLAAKPDAADAPAIKKAVAEIKHVLGGKK